MQRICRQCAAQFEGAPDASLCPDCVTRNRKNVIRDRTCRGCGITFPGGPRAWYCPDCRRERQRISNAKRRHNGTARPLGSTDTCTVCGSSYVVTSSRQRYCPACAEDACKAADRAQAREWYARNGNPHQRKQRRSAATAQIPCKICGKPFTPHDASATCSPVCSRELHRQQAQQYEAAHREERNAYQRDRRNTQGGKP